MAYQPARGRDCGASLRAPEGVGGGAAIPACVPDTCAVQEHGRHRTPIAVIAAVTNADTKLRRPSAMAGSLLPSGWQNRK